MVTLSDIATHIKQEDTTLTNNHNSLSDVAVKYMKNIPANTTGGSWYVDNASGVTDADTSVPTDFGNYDWQITQFATKNGADKFQFGTNGASMYIRSNDGGNTSTAWSGWTKLVYLTSVYNGTKSWYRKYSDGYIEQGGVHSNSSTSGTITFPTAFSGTNFSVVIAQRSTGSADTGGWGMGIALNSSRTTTTCTYSVQEACDIPYIACGY